MGSSCCGNDHAPSAPLPISPLAHDDSAAAKSLRAQMEKIAAYLANSSQSGVKVREGVLDGRRVPFLKGKHAVAALSSSKGTPLLLPVEIETNADVDSDSSDSIQARVTATLETLVLHALLIRVDKAPKQKQLGVTALQSWDPSAYYVLAHVPTSPYHLLGSIAMVAVVLAGVMFPLWPDTLRIGVLYLSYALLGLLGVLFAVAMVRLALYVVLYVVGKPGWLFPNLFADVGILESFQPVWEWDVPAPAAPARAPSASGKAKRE